MPYPQGLLYPRKIDTDFKEKADFSLFGKLLINALKPILKKIDSKIIASANVVITEGEYSQRLFENIYHRAVINCPAGADPISEQEIVTTDRFKGELKLNNLTIEKPYILLTNRHVPKKKLEYAIELAKLLKPTKFKDTPVIITGKYTDYTKVLLKTISDESISNIFFTNYTSDETTRLLYKNASLYIYTAPEEDYGKGIIQAMANGIPVIAWNNAGPSKIIKDSYSGHLIQPFNLPEMASKTIELLENHQKNQELGKNGYSETINKFSRNIHNRIILESIEPLI
jgi:glycosyltransferase involved in cell wall biosynthesis